MPRGDPPRWRARKEPVLDAWIQASVAQASGQPGEAGRYAELHVTGLAGAEDAKEYVRALHRAARRLGYSVHARTVRDGPAHRVVFTAIDKTAARAWVLATYGTDRSKWPYDPRRRGGGNGDL